MKKTLVACMAIAALFAVVSGAGAITCTVDQRPAATLLVPYFQAGFNPDGSALAGAGRLDTIITIGNASSAPMIAHVNVFNERSVLALDFNIALTGFDIQSFFISDALAGRLPSTPVSKAHTSGDPNVLANDVCQRNPAAATYPDPGGYIRVRPTSPALPEDNTLATALYPVPAYAQGGNFALQVLDTLDGSPGSLGCDEGPDGVISGTIRGYITIDHANYCNLSNPADPLYYANDAIGNENNLWGEVIFLSGAGIGTFGGSTVNIESDRAFSNQQGGGQYSDAAQIAQRNRTFYARYWSPSSEVFCTNCVGGGVNNLAVRAPWNQGFGDEREPLGLKYAVRYFDGNGVSSFWRVWRGGAGSRINLTGSPAGDCDDVLVTPSIVFYDEDENPTTVTSIPLPSPLPPPAAAINIPLETQRISPTQFPRPPAVGGSSVGWASLEFRNITGTGTSLDQAWMEYEFNGAAAFISASAPGTQLDPSSCNPLGVPLVGGGLIGANLIDPTIPGVLTTMGVGSGTVLSNVPTCSTTTSCVGTGPTQ